MNRATSIAVAGCLAVLAALTAGTIQIVRNERAEAVAEFTAEKERAVRAVAAEMDKDFANIGEVLRYAGQLFATAGTNRDRTRELGALVAVVHQYLAVQIYDPSGVRIFAATAPATRASDALRATIDEVGRRALVEPGGRIEASPPFTTDGAAWYRVFATAFPIEGGASGAVALLVDTQPLFGKVRLVAAEPGTNLLVLGAHGLPAPASTPALARAAVAPDPRLPGLARVIDAMRNGETGTARVPAGEARALGLPAAELVAAWAPVPFRGGHWSVATFSSTAPLRSRESKIVLRLAAAGAAIALCLVLFAAYALFATRRSIAMRERLAHAAQVAALLDHVPTGVLALDGDGGIVQVNRALREKLAAGATTLGAAFAHAPPAVVARLSGLVAAAVAEGRPQSVHGEHLALFGKDGQYSVHAVPLDSRFPGARVLLVVEDLSEVRSLESRLLRAEKLATVGVLAAGIAHEIGTPLGVVRGRAEYILGKLPDGSPHGPGMLTIIDQIDRVARTIRELLDFARVKPAAARAAALAPVVRAVAELLRYEAERRDVTLAVAVAEELPPVAADPDQLQQVLVNVVMNALDACARGGRVAIRAGAGAAARLEIEDDGCGIPDEHRLQVFDPFFTTKKRGQGTGLGLAIAAQIVRNHGGDIELESEVGRGTRVVVTWPLAPAKEARVAAG